VSYSLADTTGVLEEFASIGGMRDFSSWALNQTPTIRRFVSIGVTEDLDNLRAELASVQPTALVREQYEVLVEALKKAEDILIITDGMSDEEEPRTASRRKETAIHETADKFAPKLEIVLRYAFSAARRVLVSGDRQSIDKSLEVLREELQDSLPQVLKTIYLEGGKVAAKMLQQQLRSAEEFRTAKKGSDQPKIYFDFDVKRQAAIDWADQHAAELITNITETSRERISNATAEFLETGDWDEHLDEILEAVGDSDRAKLIARNEPMIAVHEGQREAWEQAVEAGLLNGDEKREWIVVGDEKVCPICEGLEGKRAKLGQAYISDEGEAFEGPPAHVSCRCSEGIV